MKTPWTKTTSFLIEDDYGSVILFEDYFAHTSNSTHFVRGILEYKWITNTLNVKVSIQGNLMYNKSSTYKHATYIAYSPKKALFYS